MKKYFFMFLMVLFLCTHSTISAEIPSQYPARPKISAKYCGIRLGGSEEQVISVLGKPLGKRNEGECIVYRYQGITVSFLDQQVVKIFIYGKGIKLPDGLVMGEESCQTKVYELYGKRDRGIWTREDGHGFIDLYYYGDDGEFVVRTIEEDFLIGVWVAAKGCPKYKQPPLEQELAGISLGFSNDEVIVKLGVPPKKQQVQGITIFAYKGISIFLKNDQVIKVLLDGNGMQSPRGLIIGLDTIHDIEHLYGTEYEKSYDLPPNVKGGYTNWHYHGDGFEFVARNTGRDWIVRAFWIEVK